MLRLLKPAGVALLAFLVVLAPGGMASAHDELISSDPADGETVDEAPEELVLTYSASIATVGAQLQITDEDGNDVADGDPEVVGTDLIQALTELGSGDYEVVWRVTSSDGHPISGTFGFTVAAAAEPEETEEATEDAATEEATEDDATEDDATEEATEDEATDEATEDDATEEATEDEATEDATENDATEDTTDSAQGGLPGWVWVVVGVAALALLALLARTWSRGRS